MIEEAKPRRGNKVRVRPTGVVVSTKQACEALVIEITRVRGPEAAAREVHKRWPRLMGPCPKGVRLSMGNRVRELRPLHLRGLVMPPTLKQQSDKILADIEWEALRFSLSGKSSSRSRSLANPTSAAISGLPIWSIR